MSTKWVSFEEDTSVDTREQPGGQKADVYQYASDTEGPITNSNFSTKQVEKEEVDVANEASDGHGDISKSAPHVYNHVPYTTSVSQNKPTSLSHQTTSSGGINVSMVQLSNKIEYGNNNIYHSTAISERGNGARLESEYKYIQADANLLPSSNHSIHSLSKENKSRLLCLKLCVFCCC